MEVMQKMVSANCATLWYLGVSFINRAKREITTNHLWPSGGSSLKMGLWPQRLLCYSLVTKSYLTLLQSQGLCPSKLLCPLDFPGKNIGDGCHFLLKGIFLTQRSNLYVLQWQVASLPLSHQGNPQPHVDLNYCWNFFLKERLFFLSCILGVLIAVSSFWCYGVSL